MSLAAQHQYSCLSIGHFDRADELRLTTPPRHRGRAAGALRALVVLPSANDEKPCLLARFALRLGVVKRPGQQQVSVSVLEPLCVSISQPMLLFFYASALKWLRALEVQPLAVRRASRQVAVRAAPPPPPAPPPQP